MKDVTSILQSLGFLDSEIKTYLAALDYGAQTIMDVSRQTKLSRQATYVAVEGLTKRGIMTSVLRGKKRFYMAEHPSKLLAYAKQRQEEMRERTADLERMVPELALQMGGEKPVVRMYEGKEGIRAIIEEAKSVDFQESVEMTDLDALYAVLTRDDLQPYRDELKKMGVQIRGLYAGEESAKKLGKPGRYVLPASYGGFKSNIAIHGNKIVMVTFEGKMYSVVIESPHLARALAILFDFAMKGAGAIQKK